MLHGGDGGVDIMKKNKIIKFLKEPKSRNNAKNSFLMILLFLSARGRIYPLHFTFAQNWDF